MLRSAPSTVSAGTVTGAKLDTGQPLQRDIKGRERDEEENPCREHLQLCDQHLSSHIAILFITLCPCSASVPPIQPLSAFTCLV